MTGNEYAAETDWSKEQDKGKVSKGRNTKCQNRSIQISSLNDTREKILPKNTSPRVRARAPGCGLERHAGCGPERQGVGQSARVWARAPGCGPECQGVGGQSARV